jgi:hypothetical protein
LLLLYIDVLYHVLYANETKLDVINITETWLNSSVSNAMLDPLREFTIFRLDRPTKTGGGGVCVFIRKDITAIEIPLLTYSPTIECVCIDLLSNTCEKFRIFTFYRPGGSSSDDRLVMNNIVHCINDVCRFDMTCLIVGDLNCNKIDWSKNCVLRDPLQKLFFDTVSDLGFQQFVIDPTRNDNIIDIVLCNDSLLVLDLYVASPFSTSDHCMISFMLNFSWITDKTGLRRVKKPCDVDDKISSDPRVTSAAINWYKADWAAIKSFLSNVKWEDYIFASQNVDTCWENFYAVLSFAVSTFVPVKTTVLNDKTVVNKNTKGKVHYPKAIRKLISRKNSLWRKYRDKRTKKRKLAYLESAKRCKSQLEMNALEAENKILSGGNLGNFYRFVNSKLNSKSGVGPLKNGNEYVTSPSDKASLLNDYFCNACTVDNNVLPLFKRRVAENIGLSSISFSHHDIFKILTKLKPSLAGGPDGLPPIFFKTLAQCLAHPLSVFYEYIFSLGALPSVWNTALVTPVFKKGCSSVVANYRPISLTCVACKIFESTIKAQFQDYLLKHSLLNTYQHGFVAGHSTCTNLLESLNDWTINLRNKSSTRVAFIDFSHAFDSVCHTKLLLKLSSYGIHGNLHKVIESFLSNRSQRVVIDDVQSRVCPVKSGVPQGSVLGPLLFIVFINDLPDIFSDTVISKCFADDIKLYTDVSSGDDIDELQFNIDSLVEWANAWQLGISFLKCSTFDIALGKRVGEFCENSIEGNELAHVTDVKDLGITLDNCLSFTAHINQIVAKAKQRTFLIFRAFRTKNPTALIQAYKSYILPMLDYCSSVWSPSLLYNIVALESVQRLFTRRIPGMKYISYPKRLVSLKLPSLELRRLRSDLVLCYKILHGFVAGPPECFGLIVRTGVVRGNGMRLFKEHVRIDSRKHFFSSRICSPWNSLPEEVVLSNSVFAFKKSLLNCNLSKFLQQETS